MKKLIVLSLLTVMLLGGDFLDPAHAQSPASDVKPTFINPTPTPGLYVNGWPAFTVSYPKDWVEMPRNPGTVFQVGAPRPNLPPSPALNIIVGPTHYPVEDWAKDFMPVWVVFFKDTKVLSDKPFQLKDGTPAREVETEWVLKDGTKRNGLLLATKKDATGVWILLGAGEGKLGEDVKSIAHSLTFLQGREEPVQVPPDVRAFLDMYCVDVMSHDVKTIMAHFSDRFRHSGASKAFYEQYFRNDPAGPIRRGIIFC
jgi:hypothetical protein